MLFQKKIDRAMNWLKEKDKTENQTIDSTHHNIMNREDFIDREDQGKLPLEKNDFIAILISALLVFAPVLIVLVLIIILVSL